jgi:hypothetical protein
MSRPAQSSDRHTPFASNFPASSRRWCSKSLRELEDDDDGAARQVQDSRATASAGPTGAGTIGTLCDRQAESFTQLPAQSIEEVVRPNEQQRTAFENLKQASAQAADELKTSCPAQTAATPRLDAANNRLQALVQAAKTVRPRLAAFYASLGDEQKAQFNNLGQQSSTRSENAPGNR